MILFLTRTELHGLRPSCMGAGELATVPTGQIWLPSELAEAPTAAQQPVLEDIEPHYDHEFAFHRHVNTNGRRLAIEVVRTNFTLPDEAQLYRLVTTLVATPLTMLGPGTPIDISAFTDPFSSPIEHPVLGTPAALDIRFYFIWDTDRGTYAEIPLVTTEEVFIPRGVGVPNMPEWWGDFRYAWQSRYTDYRRSSFLPEGFGRLFVVLSAPANTWNCRAGGLVDLRLSRKRPRRDMPGVIVR